MTDRARYSDCGPTFGRWLRDLCERSAAPDLDAQRVRAENQRRYEESLKRRQCPARVS